MPASTAYQATYLEPTVQGAVGSAVTPLGKWRFKVAGALFVLQQKLREGNGQAAAQNYVAASNYFPFVKNAAADLNNQTILTDFQAIDSL